jgi:hypothetical protein
VSPDKKRVDSLNGELMVSRERLSEVRSGSGAWRVLPLLVGHPVVNADCLMDALTMSEMTALRALNTLTTRGVMSEMTGKARGRIFQHGGIWDILDDCAESIRRQSPR